MYQTVGAMTDHKADKSALLRSYALPDSFYRVLAEDVPVDAWLDLLQRHAAHREVLFKGFPARPEKLSRNFRQPEIQARLVRILSDDAAFLAEVIDLWGVARIKTMVFLEILDPDYLVEELERLKNLIGPERYFAALYLLDRLADDAVRAGVTESYWERRLDADSVEAVLPLAEFWQELMEGDPQWREALAAVLPAQAHPQVAAAAELSRERDPELRRKLHAAEERRQAVENKLAKLKEEHQQLQEQTQRHRQENEDLRRELTDWQDRFAERLEAELDRQRRERWERYQDVDEAVLQEASKNLEDLLHRADRALERQRQADAQYGTAAAVRQQLLQVTLYLGEIERVYADSLVIHPDVARVKDALLKERERLLNLPGIDRVLQQEPELALGDRLGAHLQLLDPIPSNLSKVTQWHELVNRLRAAGLADEAEELAKIAGHKQRQIMEALYARFHQGWQGPLRNRPVRHLDDLVRTGAGKDYDLFVDGYNILLRVQGAGVEGPDTSFAAIREQFIAAVARKSSWFHRVVLVFDGIGESRDRHGNLEVVYADRNLGNTADAVIIRALQKRSSQRTLLVTADREIIESTGKNVYALIDPYHFYGFVFDLDLPPSEAS
jgi:molecular chaperone GrpE (heat shock protein)